MTKEKNGGRSIIINDTVIDVLSEYTPTWKKITAAEAETADGQRLSSIRGYLFSLSVETYGLTENAKDALIVLLQNGELELTCGDYSGGVDCEFGVVLDNDNYYGTYYTVSAVFTAKNIDTTHGTSNTIKIGDIVVPIKNTYKTSWEKESSNSFTTWDGRTIETVKGWRFRLSVDTYALSVEELAEVRNACMVASPVLTCEEYSGNVICTSISPEAVVVSGGKRYYTMSMEFSAAVLDTTHSGSL